MDNVEENHGCYSGYIFSKEQIIRSRRYEMIQYLNELEHKQTEIAYLEIMIRYIFSVARRSN